MRVSCWQQCAKSHLASQSHTVAYGTNLAVTGTLLNPGLYSPQSLPETVAAVHHLCVGHRLLLHCITQAVLGLAPTARLMAPAAQESVTCQTLLQPLWSTRQALVSVFGQPVQHVFGHKARQFLHMPSLTGICKGSGV